MGYSIKQHDTVEYLGCQLDSKLNGIGIKRPKENKCQTKIPLSEKHIPNSCVWKLLCNALISHICVCSSWLPLLKRNLKIKVQKTQNKYMCFCLNLPLRSRISSSHIRNIKLSPARDRVQHCIVKTIFKC